MRHPLDIRRCKGARAGRLAGLFGAIVFAASPLQQATAQEAETRAEIIQQERLEKAQHLAPAEPEPIEKKLAILNEQRILRRFSSEVEGVYPKIGGSGSGQGFAMGVGYRKRFGPRRLFKFDNSATIATSASWAYELGLSAPQLANGRTGFDLHAEHRDLTRVDFFGIGPDSELSNRTSFKLEDTAFDGTVFFRPSRRYVEVGATAGALLVNTGPGNRPDYPSTEELFSPAEVPGLANQSNFLRYGVFAQVDSRDNASLPRSGALLRAALTFYDDRTLGLHDFRKIDLEAQKYFGFFNGRRVILLRGHTELDHAADGRTVPFYLKPYVGGSRELRGFRNYRFYDDNILAFNAEYRWEAFSGLDMALFFDAGQAAPHPQDFDLGELETAAGFGFRFNIRNTSFLRLDFGFSHEGARVWLKFGSPF